ncbi:MAG: hypothetical protein M1824_006489 [Vezdaea acicularis]|nr:MAG: hypothetical protein M1824_006489 [Vezdaea acicularis]
MADARLIDSAFRQDPTLLKAVLDAIAQTPQQAPLFNSISRHVLNVSSSSFSENGPAAKKRRLDVPSGNDLAHRPSTEIPKWRDPQEHADTVIPDLSFSIPQRKKLTLEFTDNGVRAKNPSTQGIEFGVSWGDIEHIALVPVPDKAARFLNLIIFPCYSSGIPSTTSMATEPILISFPEQPPNTPTGLPLGTTKTTFTALQIINCHPSLKQANQPTADEFASAIPQPHRKDEPAYHAKCFRGTKDGYLFFLPGGLLWCFKKPLLFASFAAIESVSYTSILQRTFNLVVSLQDTSSDGATKEEVEFSMIDQAEFAGVDAWVKKHALDDKSLAAERRAKKEGVNGAATTGEEPEEEEGGEIAKAVQQLEDEEDEEEEDYDPGSEGESEGSGSSTDDDADQDGPDGPDLVEKELGSEAEDVELSDAEEK